MTTLNNARRALLELADATGHLDNKFTADRISVIGAYLDSLVPLNIENHIPGEKITAEQFHALYGMDKQAAYNALCKPMLTIFSNGDAIKPLDDHNA